MGPRACCNAAWRGDLQGGKVIGVDGQDLQAQGSTPAVGNPQEDRLHATPRQRHPEEAVSLRANQHGDSNFRRGPGLGLRPLQEGPDLRDIIPPWSHASRPHLGTKTNADNHHRIYTIHQSDYSVYLPFAFFVRVGSVRRSAFCR